MLIGAGVRYGGQPMRTMGGAQIGSVERARWGLSGALRNFHVGEATVIAGAGISLWSGYPLGSLHPASWSLPNKAGAMVSRGNIIGSGGASGPMQSGYNIAADVTGSGGITASAGLIITLAAAIAGSGGVTSGATKALATMVASLAGSGNITAAAAGLAAMTANLTGAGSMNANNTALADITASIVGYGEATSQGIRDAVWSAIASEFNAAGSMGAKLNTASSGGVDTGALADAVWAKVIEAGYTADQILRLLAAHAAGAATGLDGANPQFVGLDGTTVRIDGTLAAGTRTIDALDGS